jgi:hypothetical protein
MNATRKRLSVSSPHLERAKNTFLGSNSTTFRRKAKKSAYAIRTSWPIIARKAHRECVVGVKIKRSAHSKSFLSIATGMAALGRGCWWEKRRKLAGEKPPKEGSLATLGAKAEAKRVSFCTCGEAENRSYLMVMQCPRTAGALRALPALSFEYDTSRLFSTCARR